MLVIFHPLGLSRGFGKFTVPPCIVSVVVVLRIVLCVCVICELVPGVIHSLQRSWKGILHP